ncbi:sigma factor-like helix-turn-helix DNA-binding protein [Paenibacillus tundrae]
MDNNQVIKLLTDYRSYKFALNNLGGMMVDGDMQRMFKLGIYDERIRSRMSNYDTSSDHSRYSRIVTLLESAVDYVLSDDQRTIIQLKYMDRNKLNLSEIADRMHKDRKTVSTQHKKALSSLSKAMMPLKQDYMEITNFDHMFEEGWEYKEPA